MFCDRCGAPVQPAQRFCGACGKDLIATAAVPYAQVGRVQEHLRLVSILWLVLSALNLVCALVLWILAHGLFPHLHEMGAPPEAPTAFLVSLFSMLASLVFVKALAGFFCWLGAAQPRTLGTGANHRSVIPGIIKRAFRHRPRDLQSVGSSAGGVGR